MPYFIWSKMQMDLGLLSQILVLKEAERLAGDGVFWWGIAAHWIEMRFAVRL